MVRAHLQEALVILARLADKDRFHRGLHIVVDAAPADPAIKDERLVMGIEHQFLRLPKIDPHEWHPAVRQLHVRCLDHQRQPLERDRLVAPIVLVRFARRKAHRHIGLCRCPSPFAAPGFGIAVHAVVRAVIAATPQRLEQALRRAPLTPRQLGFSLQDLDQILDPRPQLGRWLRSPRRISERRRLRAPDDFADRRPRNRQRPHDLLDRTPLLEIGTAYLANQVHAYHPQKTFPAANRQRKGH